jgi:hypothetical protein
MTAQETGAAGNDDIRPGEEHRAAEGTTTGARASRGPRFAWIRGLRVQKTPLQPPEAPKPTKP